MAKSWADRNQDAQALGYRNYYDYRVHNYGRNPPEAPTPSGSDLSRLRGHRSYADLQSDVNRGRVEMFIATPEGKRNPDGTYQRVNVTVIRPDGSQDTFRLRGNQMNKDNLRALSSGLAASGAFYLDTPSLDLGLDDDDPGDYDDLDFDDFDYDEAA